MSTDYFLASPSRKRRVMVGSVGLSGIQSFPGADDVVDFIRWAIEESVRDIVMVDEHRLEAMEIGL